MVWEHVGHKSWVMKEREGAMFAVRLQDNQWIMQYVDTETGEILRTEEHGHPLEAMSSAYAMYKALDETVEAVQEMVSAVQNETSGSTSEAPATEATC